ncbi:MAG TPA: helix-turn-helix domain-containing protein [Mycetocola sp.]|jgi:hypothetical protein|nr:helix-turn-helix domain-containing protein [Mycetocola sp.]
MDPVIQPLTVGGLIDTLGSQLLWSVAGTTGLHRPVSIPIMYDPLEEIPDVPGGILLLIGLEPGSADFDRVTREAGLRGLSAIIFKRRGADAETRAGLDADAGVAKLTVVDDVPWSHVGNLIAAAMRSRSMSGEADNAAGSDLFVLANAVATALGGSAAIEDSDRNVLAYSTLEHHPMDELRRNGILARQVPDLPKHNKQYREVMLTEGVVHFPLDPSDGELPRCAAAIRAGKEELGSIWVIEDGGPVSRDAEVVLLEATRLAAVQMLYARDSVNVERQVRAEWLRSVLDGSGIASSTAGRFGIAPDTSALVVAFMFAADAASAESPVQPLVRQLVTALEQYFGVLRANVSCTSIGPIAYLLLPSVRDVASATRLVEGAASTVKTRLGREVFAAISSPAAGAADIAVQRHEVDEVLSVLSNDRRLPHISTAAQIHSQVFLMHLARELGDTPTFRHPGVRALIEHDSTRRTAYRASLCAWFSAMGDVGAAARELTVHPNTLRYRIRRAESLFGLRLDNPDEQLAVWLQLRLSG